MPRTTKTQGNIPTLVDAPFVGLRLGELKTHVKEVYLAKYVGIRVKNQHKGITVTLSRSGLQHVLHARNVGYVKLKALLILPQLIEQATFTNFNEADTDDSAGVLGYLNFKSQAIIEGKMQVFRIVVRLTISGKFYYDHAVRVKK